MNKAVIIGGDHYNALGLARVFGVNGIKPYGILVTQSKKTKDNFCYASKYWQKTYFVSDEEEAICILNQKFSNYDEKPVLIPSSDGAAIAIDRYADSLQNHFVLPGFYNEYGKLALLMDKYNQNQWASQNGLKVAQSTIVHFDGSEKKQIAKVKYSCIVKPVLSAEGEKSDIRKCDNEKELLEYLRQLSNKGYKRILVQEFLTKDYEAELFGAILQNTDEIPYLLSRHIREWPPIGGSVSFHEFIEDEALHKKALEILKNIKKSGYRGNIDIEIFVIGNEIYLNEVNFRNSGDVYACFAPQVHYPYYSYLDMIGNSCKGYVMEHKKKTYAMNETTDFRHAVYGTLSFFDWLSCYKQCQDFAIKFPGDMKPVRKRYLHYLKEFFKNSRKQKDKLA